MTGTPYNQIDHWANSFLSVQNNPNNLPIPANDPRNVDNWIPYGADGQPDLSAESAESNSVDNPNSFIF